MLRGSVSSTAKPFPHARRRARRSDFKSCIATPSAFADFCGDAALRDARAAMRTSASSRGLRNIWRTRWAAAFVRAQSLHPQQRGPSAAELGVSRRGAAAQPLLAVGHFREQPPMPNPCVPLLTPEQTTSSNTGLGAGRPSIASNATGCRPIPMGSCLGAPRREHVVLKRGARPLWYPAAAL